MYYENTVPQFTKALLNLKGILTKAEAFATARNIQPEVLLQSRLIADQFPLIRQIQIACDNAKYGVARLTGKTAPAHEDKETTLAQAKQRIESTIEFLNSVRASDFESANTRSISLPFWKGKTMNGDNYLVHYLIPNFYFHLTTAYAILRKNGVEIGKGDYLGELPFN